VIYYLVPAAIGAIAYAGHEVWANTGARRSDESK
jgi:hypothetical protein